MLNMFTTTTMMTLMVIRVMTTRYGATRPMRLPSKKRHWIEGSALVGDQSALRTNRQV